LRFLAKKAGLSIHKGEFDMKIIRCKNYEEMSREAAKIVEAVVALKNDAVLGFATGSTPEGLYANLAADCKAGKADFSKMSDTPLYISEVRHKTYIQVDENGTKAAAATSVIMNECAAMPPEDFRTVKLDRPFVYMILDANDLPLFIGVITQLG
jgi:hypothetical protein